MSLPVGRSLADALDDALGRLPGGAGGPRPGARGAATVTATAGGVRAEVEVADLDRLGTSVGRLRVSGSAPGAATGRAAALPAALDALGVPVAPVEVDARLGGAVLRSAPQREGFFEVRADGAGVAVERLRVGPEGRARVPFALAREQLGRLVEALGDLAAHDEP